MDPRYKSPTTAVIDQDVEFEFRDLTTFTTMLVWMLRVGAVLAATSIWMLWRQLHLMARDYTPEEAAAAAAATMQREALIGGTASFLMLATLFVFGRWIVLAHRNLPALGAQRLEVRPGWALGCFFIPVLNWWKPYQAMRSLWRSSRSVHRPELEDSTWVLPAWWTFWVIYSLLGNAMWSVRGRAGVELGLVENAAYLFLCILASLVVSGVWQAQAYQRDNPEEAPRGFADAPA